MAKRFCNITLIKNIKKFPISDIAKHKLLFFIKTLAGPDSLKCIVLAAKSYLKMYEMRGFSGLEETVPEFDDLCRELVAKNKEILKAMPEAGFKNDIEIKKQTRGVYRDYPIYTAMIFSYPLEREKFNRLRQALFLANQGQKNGTLELLNHDVYFFSLLIRKLTDIEAGQKWFSCVSLDELKNFETLRGSLLKLQGELDKKSPLKEPIKACNNFLNATCGLPVKRNNRKQENGREVDVIGPKRVWGYESQNEQELLEVVVEGDPDEADIYPKISAITNKPNEEEVEEAIEFGLEPEEIPAKVMHYLCALDDGVSAAGQAFQIKLRKSQTLNVIEKENQNLLNRYQSLNDQDVHNLFMTINNEIKIGNGLIAMAVHTIFSLSAATERVKHLKIIRTVQRKDYFGMPNQICYDLDTLTWLLTPFDYEYKTEDIDGSEKQSLKVNQDFVELPDMFEFYKLIKRVCGALPGVDIFSSIENFELEIKRLIKKTDRGITPSKIQNQILRSASSKIDPAVATLMTGSKLHTSSATKYYTTRSLYELYNDYQKCTQYYSQLLDRLPTRLDHADTLKGYVGARYTPSVEHVKSVITSLKNKLAYIKSEKGENWWIDFHNWYTVYCVYAQLFITGLRAVKNPFLNLDRFIFNDDIAVFRDKDGEDEYQTRNIPCHSMVKVFSVNYNYHLNKIKKRYEKLDLDISIESHIFFIGQDYKLLEARPKNIAKYLKEFSVLPLNSNRKFLRNYLMRSDVSNISINTFLGHGSRGEKYSERFLTRDLHSIREEINPAIDQLIVELEIESIKGLLR
jgi:ribosomal protein L31